jgi:hypothetical protein
MPEMPSSPPSHFCLRTKPRKTKPMPIVVTARKSWRTRSDVSPTTIPIAPAIAIPASRVSGNGTPSLAR